MSFAVPFENWAGAGLHVETPAADPFGYGTQFVVPFDIVAAPLVDQVEHPFSQRLTDGIDLYVQPCHGMEIEGAQKNFVLGRRAVGGHWNIVWGCWRVEM